MGQRPCCAAQLPRSGCPLLLRTRLLGDKLWRHQLGLKLLQVNHHAVRLCLQRLHVLAQAAVRPLHHIQVAGMHVPELALQAQHLQARKGRVQVCARAGG